jgi:agmatinase
MTPEKNSGTKDFDPNDVGLEGTLFGLPEVSPEDADVIVFPVPWDTTTSYRPGTSKAPKAIVDASAQIDFYLPDIADTTSIKYAVSDKLDHLSDLNDEMRPKAETVINTLSEGKELEDPKLLEEINAASEQVNQQVQEVCGELLDQKKTVVLLGGDHSTPLGFMRALAERYSEFGVLHIDAHADLRDAYEGFTYSHASIMRNATKIPQITKFVQVGIRDYCEAEVKYAESLGGRVKMFTSEAIADNQAEGATWSDLVDEIVFNLPQNVYISFDIDGLKQEYCPSTGTPVPGGLEYEQALYLLKQVVKSGKTIIGADLNEVGYDPNNEWDAVVGMRLLFRLCTSAACSQGKLKRKNGVRL